MVYHLGIIIIIITNFFNIPNCMKSSAVIKQYLLICFY